MKIEQFISWVEDNTLIELNPAQWLEDQYIWCYFDSKDQKWISSEGCFDSKLDALKDLLERIDSISVDTLL